MGKHHKDDSSAENIKVIVRCRPLNSKEKDAGYKSCVDLDLSEATVTVNHVMGDPDRFTFDAVVNNTLTQRDIFVQFIAPMIDSVMNGFNATVFAYGQSGSGKTHTMTGVYDDEQIMGVIPRTFRYVFNQARQDQDNHPGRKYQVSCSFVELYNNKLRDLLAEKQETLDVKENKDKSFYVKGALIPTCKTVQDLITLIEEGTHRRQTASTELNADSSRSHSIFTLIVEMVETSEDGDVRAVTSKLNLVDLAGSERISKTGATGDTLKEGCNINLSLSNLGTVIDCLVKAKPHIPFRSNPLTMLLKDSLGGNSKTCMFANLGPSEHNISETISTLRFADRAKQIKNKPVVQLDVKDQKIQELMEQLHSMREKLKMFEGAGVKGLEDDLEETKEKLGEAEVKLDNAEKSREADREEFLGRLQTTESERDELQKLCKELQLAVETGKEEREMIEQQLKSANKRKKEWRHQLQVELGLLSSSSSEEDENNSTSSNNNTNDDNDNNNNTIENVLSAIRDIRNTYIDPQVHESKVSDLDGRRKTAEQEVAALNASVDSLKQQLADMSVDFEQAKKKTDRLTEKLDREKESRRQIADTDVAAMSPARSTSMSFRRPSMADLKSAMHHQQVVASSAANNNSGFPTAASSSSTGAAGAAGGSDQLQSEIDSQQRIIEQLREQIASGKEVQMMTEEVERIKQGSEQQQKKLMQQIDELTASLSAAKDGDEPQDALLKRALLAKDAALKAALNQTTELEKRISQLVGMRKTVAMGEVREIQSDLVHESGAMRQALAADLEHVSSHRNKLLNLLSKKAAHKSDGGGAGGVSAELAEELHEVTKENDALRAKATEQSDKTNQASEIVMLRTALVDHKKAGEDAVKMANRNAEKLNEKILLLEEAAVKAQENALEIFLKEHRRKKSKSGDDGDVDDDEDEEEDDPMRTAVAVLQREKSSLVAEVHVLSRELQAAKVNLALLPPTTSSGVVTFAPSPQQQAVGGAGGDALEVSTVSHHDEGSFEALRQECLRLRALLGQQGSLTPTAGGGRSPASSKSPMSKDESPTSANDKNPFSMDLQQSFVELEQNIQSQVNTAQLEASELRDDLEAIKAELQEANERRETAIKDRTAAQSDAADLKQQLLQLTQQLEDSKSRVTSLEEESQKAKAQLEQQYGTQVQSLEGRLQDYTEQLAVQNKLVEKQTSVGVHLKERADNLQAELDKQAKEAKAREDKLHKQLEQQEASFQRLVTRRLEEQKEQNQKNLIRKDDENHALRKKMKKLEDMLDDIRREYDEKVCEYEELYSAMEETKTEALKNFMHHSRGNNRRRDEVVQLEQAHESREKVDDALQAARDARKKKKDAFAEGALVGVHARATSGVGSGTSHAKAARHGGGGGGAFTPPNEFVGGSGGSGHGTPTTTNNYSHLPDAPSFGAASSSSSSNTARPHQRTVISSNTGGGSGYTGYVAPAPPPISPVLQPLAPVAPAPPPGAKPMTGRPPGPFGGTIGGSGGGHHNQSGGGGGGDDDMYYF